MRLEEPLCNAPNVRITLAGTGLKTNALNQTKSLIATSCGVALRYTIDEGTYFGAQHKTVEVIDE